ncbi:MAG: 30S ribosomal protein S1 [Bacteroidetes bacterium GWE2_29_8]|nr:MAG: 30S ribosomal protein S1 [Bacteroidetes bacterium GWE2_29_8]OFY18618.1 MAG: 30S ribosomal protein S1 [Bacteroidetes bacterium GWF2_29_10]
MTGLKIMVENQEEIVNTSDVEVVALENVETPVETTKVRKEFKNPYSLENFSWETSGENEEYTAEQRAMYEVLYDQTLKAIAEHEVIEGVIVGKTTREVIVNIGYKSDGTIPISELRYLEEIKIGDKIDVYIETNEDSQGQLVLSHKKARVLKAWDRVNSALENEEIILGFIKCRTKGGMIVDVFGIEAFLPGSQIDVKPIRDYDFFVGKTMEFKVVKINHEFKNVVVSHKALIEAELELQKKAIMANLKKGDILEGTVKNITSYGVFVDLGGVDGLIHITDLSWGRINNPEEIVQLDQKINVVILDFDDEKKRIALGLKQLSAHPWDALSEGINTSSVVKGKVVVIADYGAFIEIAPGVEGLIHVSEMTWSQHLRSAQEFLKIGDEVEAIVLTIDRENRKMSFGIKQLRPDPWNIVEEKYQVNTKHVGVVRNFTNFGVFVELEEGIDGLIHISDLSWSKKIKHPAEFTNINEEIEVVVLGIDKENRRLSLGHKQIEENPWDVFETVFTVDSIHQGTIMTLNDKGAIISLPYGVEGFSPIKHIIKENNVTADVDETLDFKVIEFNKENKKIVISHSRIYLDKLVEDKDKEEDENKKKEKETKKATKKIKDNLEKTTFGDIEALANLKSDMDEREKEENK